MKIPILELNAAVSVPTFTNFTLAFDAIGL